jgi:hypothetical protein
MNFVKWGREYNRGKYHNTVDLLFERFGISCMTSDNCFYLLNRLIQTSQTGGQWYSDTSPFSIPWMGPCALKWLNYSFISFGLGCKHRDPLVYFLYLYQ